MLEGGGGNSDYPTIYGLGEGSKLLITSPHPMCTQLTTKMLSNVWCHNAIVMRYGGGGMEAGLGEGNYLRF